MLYYSNKFIYTTFCFLHSNNKSTSYPRVDMMPLNKYNPSNNNVRKELYLGELRLKNVYFLF